MERIYQVKTYYVLGTKDNGFYLEKVNQRGKLTLTNNLGEAVKTMSFSKKSEAIKESEQTGLIVYELTVKEVN